MALLHGKRGIRMNNKKMFKKWISVLGEIHDKEISDILRDEYWEFLQPYTDKQCEEVFKKIFETMRVFPELRDFLIAWKRIEFEKIYQSVYQLPKNK